MDCLVGGANFLLKAIHHEAFMYENSQTLFTPSNCEPRCPLDNGDCMYVFHMLSSHLPDCRVANLGTEHVGKPKVLM